MKKILISLLALIMTASAVSLPQNTKAIKRSLADVDNNGKIDTHDATIILRHVAELDMLSENDMKFADANQDGMVDSADATQVLRFVVDFVEYVEMPEEPKPTPDPDPEPQRIEAKRIRMVASEIGINKGDSIQILTVVTPENTTDKITYESSDESVATVDKNGCVKALKCGYTMIRAWINNRVARCKVTVTPRSDIRFAAKYMPFNNTEFLLGQVYSFDGKIMAEKPLRDVTLTIYDTDLNEVEISKTVTFEESDKVMTYSTKGKDSIDSLVKFATLKEGNKKIELKASTRSDKDIMLWKANFQVHEWCTLAQDKFFGERYADCLAYFGNTDEFLYRYTLDEGRYIKLEKSWSYKYIVSTVLFNGKTSYVHTHAKEAFEKAAEHINNAYVYFKYSDGNTGVFALKDIVNKEGTGGTFVPRFQEKEMLFISHHGFGTAIDVNYTIPVNTNKYNKETGEDVNWDAIEANIKKLKFDGLKNIDEHEKVYCFTFNGPRQGDNLVPDELRNYLLHEIGFAREGFSWGGYYVSGCDAMHFSLTEGANIYRMPLKGFDEEKHENLFRERMQLVFDYAD